jgi:hypothetical protein
MSLRIRRGTNADRLTITPDDGELIYVNGTGTNARKLYIGDGQTVGGRNIGEALAGNNLVWDNISQTLQAVASGGGTTLPPNALGFLRNNGAGSLSWTTATTSVAADPNPLLGGNLTLSGYNIAGTGNIDINGNIKGTNLSGNLTTTTGNTTIINGATRAATLSRIILDTNGSITSPAILVDSAAVTFVTNTFSNISPYINFYIASSLSDQTGSVGLIRSRGTTISPSAVVNGDELGSIITSGFSGSQFTFSTDIVAVVDGTVSAGVVPSRLDLKVSNTAGVRATAMSIKSTQVDFIVPPKLPVAATDAARAALVPTPSTGMMIFMTSGTTPAATNKVQVYDSTAWVNLH